MIYGIERAVTGRRKDGCIACIATRNLMDMRAHSKNDGAHALYAGTQPPECAAATSLVL